MPRERSELERACGQLINSIQKEWHKDAGESAAEVSEEAMNKAHYLLQQSRTGSLQPLLKGRSISQFIGSIWVAEHPSIANAIQKVQQLSNEPGHT